MSDSSFIRKAQKADAGKYRYDISRTFCSAQMEKYLNTLMQSMIEEPCANRVHVVSRDTDTTAMTNGEEILINANSSLIRFFPRYEQQTKTFMGLFFHEMSHILFTDFEAEKKASKKVQDSGIIPGYKLPLSKKENQNWDEFTQLIAKGEREKKLFVYLFHEILNICIDVHDENALMDIYDQMVIEPLLLCRSSLQSQSSTFDQIIEQLGSGEYTNMAAAFDMLLQMARFGNIIGTDDNTQHPLFSMVLECKPHLEMASNSHDTERRFSEISYIIFRFWDLIAKNQNIPPQGNQSSNDPNANSNSNNNTNPSTQSQNQPAYNQLSQDEYDKIMSELQKAAKNANASSQTPQGNSNQPKLTPKNPGTSAQKVMQNANNAAKAAAAELAANDAEKAAAATLKEDAVTVCNASSSHQGIPLDYNRKLQVPQDAPQRYEKMMAPLKPISKRLQRQITEALRDLKDGYVAKHRQSGKTFVVNDAYRPDGRYFATKKLPEDYPDMAISVLIDHSGSMAGSRLETAQRAAMLMFDFASGLEIPIAISGHCTDGNAVNYINYVDFEQYTGKDKYRLTSMRSAGCNRDGMALLIAANELQKRPEEVKLLIIISDGRPNHDNYGGTEAAQDIQSIIKKCKHSGVEVIAAAIGNDRQNIAPIYGDAFLDISDLNKLPKVMTNLVRKRIIQNAF